MSAAGEPAPASAQASPAIRASEALRKKLAKIGLHREADLLVHLPLRYEDETRITPVASAPWGEPVQVEVVVSSCEVQFRFRPGFASHSRVRGAAQEARQDRPPPRG